MSVYAQNDEIADNLLKGSEYYDKGDYKTAFKYYMLAAKAGNADAQGMIGVMYNDGLGTAQDYTKAYEWYTKAANQGDKYAQVDLGILYENGNGVNQDYMKAYEWFQKAANQEFRHAQFRLGRLYYFGNGVNQDYIKAFEWFLKAANQDEKKSCLFLGSIFNNGYGVNQDYMKAFEWYSKAAEVGNAEAQNSIGDLYYYGNGVNQDYLKAFEWYKKAAENGYAEAQFNIGHLYDEGYGVKQSYDKALEWYTKAVNSGYTLALRNLGYLFEKGHGVKQDYKKAFELYSKATVNEDDVAPYYIGKMYLYGNGVEKDLNKSESYFRKSIERMNENPFCYSYIALIYALRDKNFKKAIDYSNLALKDEWINDYNSEDKARLYGLRGQIYYLKGDLKSAEEILTKCLELSPKYLSRDEDFAKTMSNRKDKAVPHSIKQIYTSQVINKNIFAIVIGNELYKNEVDVPYAHNDAKVFCEYVEKTLGVPHDQIRLIENAGYNDIRISVNWLTQAMKVCRGKGKAIVYYAGHGIPNESDMSAYLLPVDGIGNDPGSAYALNELYEKLGSVEAQSITIFLDACFSGSKREEGMLTSARGVAIKTKSATPKGNIIIFSAAQGDETAYPYKDMQHGMFTYYLLKKLQDSKGEVTLGELGDYLIDEVGRESFVKNGKMQTPTVIVAPSLQNSWKNLKLK